MSALQARAEQLIDDAIIIEHAGSNDTAPVWPEPTEIKADLPPAPPFDAKALLPRMLADFVLDEADRMPCSPDYVAASLVVALGSVIGASCAIKPKRRDDWIVPRPIYSAASLVIRPRRRRRASTRRCGSWIGLRQRRPRSTSKP
jgi:hypothetical protein